MKRFKSFLKSLSLLFSFIIIIGCSGGSSSDPPALTASSAKAITAFTFPTSTATTITEATHTIAVTVPFGTDKTALVPTITHTGASISPSSGVANNFTSPPQTYTVTAADASTQAYTVTVSTADFSPLFSLTDGATVNVSSFNSKTNKYATISSQPTNKPEANVAPSTTYAFSLTSFIASYIAPAYPMLLSDNKESPLSEAKIYGAGQITSDEKMRKLENELLASRTPQFSRKVTGIQFAPPASPIIGTTWNNVNIVYTGNTINTTCRHVSNHAYFFIDNRNTAAMSSYLSDYGTAFDSIYDINRARFGNENDTDVNGKVIIVFSQELTGGILGYFYPGDKFSTGDVPDSNEGDIFYMTCDALYQGDIVKGTLAHEFQHMIYFDQHYNYGVSFTYDWLNEALSQAAEYYNGYLDNHHAWISNYLNNGWSGLSLTHWTSSNYGFGAIYIRYLIDQYGNTAIRNMCSTPNVGIHAVEAATGQNFNTIFNNFTRALVLSDETTNANPAYKFTTLDLDVVQPVGRGGLTTSLTYSAGSIISGSTFAYRIVFMQWTGNISNMNLSGTYFNGAYFGY